MDEYDFLHEEKKLNLTMADFAYFRVQCFDFYYHVCNITCLISTIVFSFFLKSNEKVFLKFAKKKIKRKYFIEKKAYLQFYFVGSAEI